MYVVVGAGGLSAAGSTAVTRPGPSPLPDVSVNGGSKKASIPGLQSFHNVSIVYS